MTEDPGLTARTKRRGGAAGMQEMARMGWMTMRRRKGMGMANDYSQGSRTPSQILCERVLSSFN